MAHIPPESWIQVALRILQMRVLLNILSDLEEERRSTLLICGGSHTGEYS